MFFPSVFAGLSVTSVMFVTTCLMTLVIIIVWKQKSIVAAAFLVIFGSVELLYLSAVLFKVPDGGWISLLLSWTLMATMFIWNYGSLKKHQFDLENKVSMDRILSSGPSLGMVRVPGIGLVYTNLVTGIPAIFGHFVTNLPAFHQVLVFVCVKSVQVPYVSEKERFLVSRIYPAEYAMYRCIIRYGYKDLRQENYDFENRLVSEIVNFIEMEGENEPIPRIQSCTCFRNSEYEASDVSQQRFSYTDNRETTMQSVQNIPVLISVDGHCKRPHLKDESLHILRAREAGMAYILGHSYARAKKSSSIFKKVAINMIYAFLSRNTRQPDVVLNVPHTSLLEVGMVYYV